MPRSAEVAHAAAVPDPERPPARLPREVVLEVFAHARECYPEECCGLLLGSPGGGPARVVRCSNVQNQRHARGESELDARRAFWIDPLELLRALQAAETQGETVQAIYHSHVDAEPYLSQTDLRGAIAADGEPLWPGAAQLVVSVYDGVVRDAAVYEWRTAARAFEGRRVREELA
jgi:proteasome lid subunit RPN8/RPN11